MASFSAAAPEPSRRISSHSSESFMPYAFKRFAAKCHSILAADSGAEGRERVRELLGEVCSDGAFVATYLSDDVSTRQILYEDPELGFCIVGHVDHNSRQSRPHDHGPTWAIYGQAAGETVMTDWVIVSPPTERLPGKARRRATLTSTTRVMSTRPGAMARRDCCALKDATSSMSAPPFSSRCNEVTIT
jgi:hypothetical protein